ncbi:hypothetical protein L7F22_015588 [Adiantum nelumboides]|nr:hypothetical protein [Adiantum nelumboides]
MVEMCDIFSGFITSQSLAGGTGAGVGSYLLEVMKDEYPSCHILSHCIWPVEGEVSVQYYNVLLSLAHFQDLSDGLLLMKNEALMSTCKKVLGIQRPSFDDMNDVGARALASLLLPAYDHSRPTLVPPIQISKNAVCNSRSTDSQLKLVSCTRFRPLSELLTGLCVHPKYRMLALRATHQLPTSFDNVLSHSWISHLKQLKQMLYIESSKAVESESSFCTSKSKLNYNLHRQIDKCVANLLVLRGRDASQADISLFDDKMLYPAWAKEPLKVASNSASLGKYVKFASLLSNCCSAIAPAGHALSRAQTMYASKAYIHHYLKHGLSLDAFNTSFATVQDVLTNYMDL